MKVNTSDVVQDNATSLISPSPDDFWVTLLREWVSRTNGTLEGKSLNVEVLEAPYTPKMLVYVCCILLVPAGVAGNAMLLRMSLQPDLRSHSYSVYLSVLSVTDSLSLVYVYIDALFAAHSNIDLLQLGSAHACRALDLLINIVLTIPRWVLVVLSIDRYIAMAFPLKRKVFCTPRNARIACAVALVFALSLRVPFLPSTRMLEIQGMWLCAVEGRRIDMWRNMEVIINSVVPCVLLAFLNTQALRAIREAVKSRAAMVATPAVAGQVDSESQAQADQQRESRKLTHALLSIPVSSFLTMTPHSLVVAYIYLNMSNLHKRNSFDTFMLDSEVYFRMLFSANFAINFYLLMATSSAYRGIARKLFTCRSS